MAVTGLRGRQILDDSVVRGDLNTTSTGDAVIRKIIAGTGLSISSTGVDAGTGDVTVSQVARTINGVTYDGSANITITANTTNALTFNNGGAGVAPNNTFNGSAAVTVSYNTIGAPGVNGQNASGSWAISVTGNAATATVLQTARAINGVSFDGSAAITITANTTNALTFNNSGTGVVSGSTFNGSAGVVISYNTIGAMQNPMSALGDIIYGGASGAATRLAAGTAGQALVSAGAAAPVWTTLTLENLPDAWVKRAVKAATTANITLSGTQTIDGIALVAGDRVLVKDQTTASENGIYIVAAGAWSRAADANAASELTGAMVAVDQGTVNGGLTYDNDFKSTDTLGTTAMSWNRVIDTGYTIPVSQGGTGATTLTGVLIGAGTAAITAVAGTASQLLRRNAGNTAYEFFTHDFASTAGATFTGQIISTRANNTADGAGQIFLNGATGNRIDFNTNGVAAPAFTTRSAGTKLVLYPTTTASLVDFAIGIESNTTWFSVPSTAGYSFKWYGGTTNTATLTGAGALTLSSTATATQFIRTGGTASQFLKADGSIDSTTYLSAEVDTLATVTGRGATTTVGIGAPNFYDATGTYNVNLGSGGSEGRGIVAGYSGASYGGIGYNVRHSTTSATYIAPSTDTANYLVFNQGFTFQHAASGTAGRTISWSTLAILSATGQFRLNSYTSSTAFTGTAVANLAVDASGNILTTATAVTSVALSLPNIFTVTGSPITTSGTLTATLASQTANTFFAAPNGSAGAPTFRTIAAGDIPVLNQNTAGYSTTLLSIDDRTLAPSELTTARIAAGFGSWANNNTAPYADYLHFRSYVDGTGGNDNLVMFRKDGTIGMRIYTQTYGSATAYSTFRDVALLSASGSTNTVSKFTSANNLGNSSITDDGSSVVVNLGTFQATTSQAGAGTTSLIAANTDSTAVVSHSSRFATQQLGSGIARTLIYAASNTTGVTRGQLAVLTENGGSLILELGTAATASNYALSQYNIAGTEIIRLNTGGTSFLNGGDVSFGTNGFYYDSLNKRLGIGVASPSQVFDVSAPFAIAKFTSSTGTNAAFFQYTNTGGSMYLGMEGSASATFGATAYAATIYTSAGVPVEIMPAATKRAEFKTTGQFRLNAYTSTSSFTGTAVGVLAFDASGNILTIATPGGGSGITGTGTQNYITKFSNAGATSIGNSLLFDNGTDVGINTASPTTTTNYTSVQVNGTSGGIVRFSYGGTNAGTIYGSSAETAINAPSQINLYVNNVQIANAQSGQFNTYETFYARKLGAQIQLAGGVATASGIFQPGSNLMTIGDWATGTNGITLDVSNGILYTRSSQANGAYIIFQRSGSTDYGYIGNSAQLFGAGFNGNTELGIRSAGAINFATSGGVAIARIQTTGQLRLPLYTAASTFTGTAVGILAFDSSGNILTTAVPTSGIAFTEVTGTTQAAAINTGYIANNASLVTITLPGTAAIGSVVEIVGKGAGLWRLAQPAGLTIRFGNLSTTAGTGGWLQATQRYDSIRLVCTTANTEWTVVSVQGVIDVN